MVKGFRGAGSLLFRTANQQNLKALRYSYANRRKKKRQYRSLWITRVNSAVRRYGSNYNEFMNYLKKFSIKLNRKVIAQLAICDPESFLQLILATKSN